MPSRAGLIIAFVCLTAVASAARSADCKSTVNGDLRVQPLASKIFNNSRSIRVLLPPGYDAAENRSKRYPVLYLLDGQNLFDACLSEVSHAEWQVDEIVYRLIREKTIPEIIIVGIDHAGMKRAYEFLPYRDFLGNPDMEEPVGEKFPGFVANEVMPFVNGQYRTLTGHGNTGIGGSSYGGVATLYALMARPQTFGYGLIESPTIWVGMGQLIRDTAPLVAFPRKVFMGFGAAELAGDGRKAGLAMLDRVVANFRAAGYDDQSFRYVLEDDAKHTESAWAKRLPDALKFLFGNWTPQPEANDAGK
jgi:predicted alpha/beta superfamily hydrolase